MLKVIAVAVSIVLLSVASFASNECVNDLDRLQDLTGSYEGNLETDEGKEVPIRIQLYLRSTASGDVLEAFYKRLDRPGVLDLRLNVEVCQQLDSIELAMVGIAMVGVGSHTYRLNIRATYSELMLAGGLYQFVGPRGTFILEKK